MLISLVTLIVTNAWLIALALLPLLYWYSTRNHNYWLKQGVPGPANIPVIGNFFSLTTPISALYLDYMSKYGKLFGMFQGQDPVLVVAEPELIKLILVKDFHLFQNRTPFGQEPRTGENHTNLVDARGEIWKRVRSMVTPMFTTSKLNRMEQQMMLCTDEMLTSLDRCAQTGKTFIAHDAMGKFTMDTIAKCAFATETNASEDNVFVRSAKQLLDFKLSPFIISQIIPFWAYKLMKKMPRFDQTAAGGFFVGLAYHLVMKRKDEKEKGIKSNDDLLQFMINAAHMTNQSNETEKEDLLEAHHVNQDKEQLEQEKEYFKEIVGTKYLNEEEIISNTLVFFIAGYETTASTLAFSLFELAVNPKVQAKLYEEIEKAKTQDPSLSYKTLQSLSYLDAVLSETLRKYPPAFTAVNRACTTDQYTIPEHNVTLHKGDVVLIPIYAIHHWAEFFPEPEHFNPERFLPSNKHQIIPYTYLPFGAGPRNCVGMRFALKEAKLGLANIVDRFEIVRTTQTPNQLKLKLCSPVLKTEPIYLSAKKRVAN